MNQLRTDNGGTYTYDNADNLAGFPAGANLAHDAANQLSALTNTAGTTTFGYDTRGNRTTVTPPGALASTLTYDQANRLTGHNTANAAYRYNGDGLRTSKTVGGVTTGFTWDVTQGLPLLLVDGTTNYVYGPGGLPLEQITSSGQVTYYHQDQLGSTRALTNNSGTVVATYTYDPYGNLAGSTGTATNPFRYGGQYTDNETGYQYLRARYYDSGTGTFLTVDPAYDQTRSRYGYVDGNPLNYLDPAGLNKCEVGANPLRWAGNAVDCASKVDARDVWRPVRAAITAPVSATALAVNYGYSLLPGRDVACRWNSANWVAVCSGGPTILGAGATTFGGVINTEMSYNGFLEANDCRLMAHETKHTDQWAIFGPAFTGLDAVAAGLDWAGSEIFGWDPGSHNPFEIWAGLEDGGYR